jgi:VIT1/CCC1 family predicted Fe2+/Mn2+ transporter
MRDLAHPFKTGLSFGLTSGVITTLGLMVGLYSSTNSKVAVIGGILAIAVADAFSDAAGIHISEESEGHHSAKEIWQATIATFVSKFLVALTFIVPVLFFALDRALVLSVIWGFALISGFSFLISKEKGIGLYRAALEHLAITILVVVFTYYFGILIGRFFG